MSNQLLTIDPDKQDDQFYRYKMPAIAIKIEGNGNGIKTVFPNIKEVCQRLNRPEEIVIKFFGYELGAQSTHVKKDDKMLVMGSHTQERIQTIVYSFIAKFVLCKHCRNPETDVLVDGKSIITLKCGACGKVSNVNGGERAYSLFVTHYKNAKASKGKSGQVERKDDVHTEADAVPSAEAVSAVPIKVVADQPSIKEERPDPGFVLSSFLRENPKAFDFQVRKVIEVRNEYALSEKHTVYLVFRSIVTSGDGNAFIGRLQTHIKLLQRFTENPDVQQLLVSEAEFHCNKYEVPDKMPMCLLMLFEEGLITDEHIKTWYNSTKKKSALSPEFAKQSKEKSAPLIEWLGA